MLTKISCSLLMLSVSSKINCLFCLLPFCLLTPWRAHFLTATVLDQVWGSCSWPKHALDLFITQLVS